MASVTLKPPLWFPGRNPGATNLWRGCVGYWPMWEGAGERTADVSGYGRHGTLTDMAPSSDWVLDSLGPCLDFDGTNDHVACSAIDMAGWAELSTFVVFAWDEAGGDPNNEHTLVSNWQANTSAILLRLEPSNNQVEFLFYEEPDSLLTFTAADAAVNDTAWHTVAVTYADLLRVYLDGSPSSTTLGTGVGLDTTPSTAVFKIGESPHVAAGAGGDEFKGRIALAILWRRQLSHGEVLQLTADPFCMIRPPQLLPIYAGAIMGGAAVGGVPEHMDYYRRRRVA